MKIPLTTLLFITFVKILSITDTLCDVILVGLDIIGKLKLYIESMNSLDVFSPTGFLRSKSLHTNTFLLWLLPKSYINFSVNVSVQESGDQYIQVIMAFLAFH